MKDERTAAAERLVRLLDGARPMPLMPNRVRVDKVDAAALVEIVLMPGREDQPQENNDELSAAARRVRDALRDAYPVPLTDQVRLSLELVRELTGVLRAALGNATRSDVHTDRDHQSP